MHKKIIDRLIEEIRASGLTQKEIAKRMGVNYFSIGSYKNSNGLPNLETFTKLCRVIGADTNYVLGLTDVWNSQA